MATYTSLADGSWSSANTWEDDSAPGVPAGPPGSGDIVTSIDHDVSLSDARMIGTLPPNNSTKVLTIGPNGSLIINDGGQLTVDGNLYNNAGSAGNISNGISMNPGGILQFESSGLQVYNLLMGTYANINVAGTSDNHAIIRTVDNGNANARIYRVLDGVESITADYCDFLRIGDNSNFCIESVSRAPGQYPSSGHLSNCTFTNCGGIKVGASDVNGSFSMVDCKIIDTLETGNSTTLAGKAGSSGKLEVSGCVFDGFAIYSPSDGWLHKNNYYNDGFGSTNTSKGFADGSGENFSIQPLGTLRTLYGNHSNDLFIANLNDGGNFFRIAWQATASGHAFSNCIFDQTISSPNNPDGIQVHIPTSGWIGSINNMLVVPEYTGGSTGAIMNLSSLVNGAKVDISHITAVVAGRGTYVETGIWMGEFQGYENMASIKSCLFWSPPNNSGCAIVRAVNTTEQDFVYAENIDYNAFHHVHSGTEGWGVDVKDNATTFFTDLHGTQETHGILADPQFVDDTRCTVLYDTAGLNNSETLWSDGQSYVIGDMVSSLVSTYYNNAEINYRCISNHTAAASNLPGSGTSWHTYWEPATFYRLREDRSLITDMMSWMRSGFAPQNAALLVAHDGNTTIGAIAYQASTPVDSSYTDVISTIIASNASIGGRTCVFVNDINGVDTVDRQDVSFQTDDLTSIVNSLNNRLDDRTKYRRNRS